MENKELDDKLNHADEEHATEPADKHKGAAADKKVNSSASSSKATKKESKKEEVKKEE